MKKITTYLLVLSLGLASCKKDKKNVDGTPLLSKIAFASCTFQTARMEIFNEVLKLQPQLYIAGGDNIYTDKNYNIFGVSTRDWVKFNYGILENNQNWQKLKASVPIIATWDDHDYGNNDEGGSFADKRITREEFFNYWKIPATDPRQNNPDSAIYGSYYYNDDAHKVQIIMLDCRYNRSDLDGGGLLALPFTPTTDPNKTMLGATQWAWLEAELRKPAKVRIIVSSTMFGCEFNGYETWSNLPLEMEKMYQTIRNTRAEGVFILSGDIHYAEISKRTPANMYPLYDFTSSGTTHSERPTTNTYRVGDAFGALNFGMVDIDWNANPVKVNVGIYGFSGLKRIDKTITLDELKF